MNLHAQLAAPALWLLTFTAPGFGQVPIPAQSTTTGNAPTQTAPAPATPPQSAPTPGAPAPPAKPRDTRMNPYGNLYLCFSTDARVLRVIGLNLDPSGSNQHVRVVTYAVATAAVTNFVDLQPDTRVHSVNSDGTLAIVSTDSSGDHAHLSVLNTDTGDLQPIPDAWYPPDEDIDAALSADGKLISTYSETESATPMTVKVYDWATKTLIATRTSEFVAAGGIVGGGVTPDGQVEFVGNRVGSKIVDLKTGRALAHFGPSSVRSPDGKWQVQFPNLNWDESAPKDVLLKNGATGQTIGKLDYAVADNEIYGSLTGTFCGTSGRFLMANDHRVAAYELPSGKLLLEIPVTSWKDPLFTGVPALGCSSGGTRVAILDGSRLSFYRLP